MLVTIGTNVLTRTCSGPVASSAFLSSWARMKRGNRSEIPRWSTFELISLETVSKSDKTHRPLSSSVDWTETEISSEDLPDDLRLQPDIRLRSSNINITPRLVPRLKRLKLREMLRKDLVREPCADFTYRL